LYYLPNYYNNNIKVGKMGRALACMGVAINVYKILVGEPEGKRPLKRTKHTWENTIKLDLKETVLEGVDWIYLAQDRDLWRVHVSTVMNL
jgi:hypothetical protein